MTTSKRLEKPIIFVSIGRTGSTIIANILSKHPALAFPSNYQDIYPKSRRANYRRRIIHSQLYQSLRIKKILKKIPFIPNKYLDFNPSEAYAMWDYLMDDKADFSRGFLLNDTLSKEHIDRIRGYFDAMVKNQGKKRLTFKITGPSRIGFLLQLFPDALFIHVTRNHIPTVKSFMKVNFWEERGMHQLWWRGVYSKEEKEWAEKNKKNGALMTAFQIKKIEEITSQELATHNIEYIQVNYEDFLGNPNAEMQRMIEFTKLTSFDFESETKKIRTQHQFKKDIDYFSESELVELYKILSPKK